MASTDKEPARSDHSDRNRRDRIARLRNRLKASDANPVTLAHVLLGVLDLLEDEL